MRYRIQFEIDVENQGVADSVASEIDDMLNAGAESEEGLVEILVIPLED